jgi:hypothetical protein
MKKRRESSGANASNSFNSSDINQLSAQCDDVLMFREGIFQIVARDNTGLFRVYNNFVRDIIFFLILDF